MYYDSCPGGGMLVTGSSSPDECPEPVVVEHPGEDFFEDISGQLKFNPDQRNYGVAVTDINADGKFDFVVAGFGSRNLAYTWNAEEGSYDEIATEALQDSKRKAIGLAACDIDGDGYEELYVLNTDQYSGDTTTSDGLFDLVDGEHVDLFTEERNLESGNFVAGRSCACLDRHGNGQYGVAVANYGGDLKLFEVDYSGDAEGVLVDSAPEAGMDLRLGGRALVAGPIVTDRTDLFANNEVNYSAGDRANFMFVSEGDGTFTEQADDLGVADPNNTGRGTALFDANGDGLVDIVYGNWQGQHKLFLQEREGGSISFTDAATAAMKFPSKIRTVIVADFDNDGYEEIFWNNIPGENRLFRKLPTDDDWVQINIGDAVEPEGMGTGGAVGDFDGDGMLELVVAHGESGPLQPLTLYRAKAGRNNHYFRVIPRTSAGAPARGARVDLTADGRTQMRIIDSGSGYLCQMEPVAHFGLGRLASFVDAAARVRVQWPDGSVCEFEPLGVDVEATVRMPETEGAACAVEYPEGYEEKIAANCRDGESTAEVVHGQTSWEGETSDDLWDEYGSIFKSYNRNAASHLWAKFLFDRAEGMAEETFTHLFKSFCPVSGSPVSVSDMKRYGMELKLAAPSGDAMQTRFGSMYFCCWPCICDTLDFIRVDTKTVAVKSGNSVVEREYWFTVIANPCEDESRLSLEYTDPFRGRQTNVLQQAPELKCNADGQLEGAVLSDHGYPIIGMLHDSFAVTDETREEITCNENKDGKPGRMSDYHPEGDMGVYQSHCEYKEYCAERAADGFNSGMGEIFRKVSEIGVWHPVCGAGEGPADVESSDSSDSVEELRPCEDFGRIMVNKMYKGKNSKSRAASLCECEDTCLEKNAWAMSFLPKLQNPKKSRCTCYTKKKGTVKTKNKKNYQSVQLDL